MQDEIRIAPDLAIPLAEIELRFSRSSGPGGQNVNKTATRVELLFDVANSTALSAAQRERLLEQLGGLLDGRGVLHLASSEHASQWRNRQEVIERLRVMLAQGLRVPKRRIPTHPTRSSIERRLARKRLRADVKRQRRRPGPADW